jgi:hypothetical protein
MHRLVSLLGITALAVLGAGCSFAMRPVQVDASFADWEALAGDWRGGYAITGRDRHGVIEFRLKTLEREASGDVLMISDRSALPVTGMPPKDGFPRRPPDASQLLAIRFVAADRGMIRGTMEPYWDPDRECRAWATFLGSADGDVVTGSFISVCDDRSRILLGRWWGARRRATHAAPRDAIAKRRPLDP